VEIGCVLWKFDRFVLWNYSEKGERYVKVDGWEVVGFFAWQIMVNCN
jgi:hypothetical protein